MSDFDVRAALERLLAGKSSAADVSQLREAVSSGILATGERSVAAGAISHSIVITGDNVRFELPEEAAKLLFGAFLFVGVPALPNLIVGRDNIREKWGSQLVAGKSLAAEGLPGVGKTTLAVSLAHDLALLQHFENGVLWASLGKGGDALAQLNTWGQALGRDVTTINDPEKRAQAVKQEIGSKKILIVIDDAWEIEAAELLKVGGPYCAYLLTTRDQAIAARFSEDGSRHLDTLEEDKALLLFKRLVPEIVSAHPEEVRRIIASAGGLPLSLKLISSYLNVPRRKLRKSLSKKALDELADPARRLKLAEKRLGGNITQTLEEAVLLSLEALTELEGGGDMVRVFYALGTFAPKPATFAWEAAAEIAETNEEVLAILVERNLLEVDGDKLALHQILAETAVKETPSEAVARHTAYYLEHVQKDPTNWRTISAAWPQIQKAWESLPEDIVVLDFIWKIRLYLDLRGLRETEVAWIERGIRIAEKDPSLRYELGTLLNNLGFVYTNLGQPAQALEYYEKASKIMTAIGNRSGKAATLNNKGLAYRSTGETEKAFEHFELALQIAQEIGNLHWTAASLNNLGAMYFDLGQPVQALKIYSEALPILESLNAKKDLATTLNNIGELHEALGQSKQAYEYLSLAGKIREELGDKQGLASTLNNLGGVLDSLGWPKQALEHYIQALEIFEKIGDKAGQANTLSNIGYIYEQSGKEKEALEYLTTARYIQVQIEDKSGLAVTLNNIGRVYENLRELDLALEYYLQALPILIALKDLYKESIARYNIAMIFQAQGKLENAVEQLKRVVELDRATHHPDLANDMFVLAQIENELRKQGKNQL